MLYLERKKLAMYIYGIKQYLKGPTLACQTCQPSVLVVKTTGVRPKYLVDLMDMLT
jgi:hypothetical protein